MCLQSPVIKSGSIRFLNHKLFGPQRYSLLLSRIDRLTRETYQRASFWFQVFLHRTKKRPLSRNTHTEVRTGVRKWISPTSMFESLQMKPHTINHVTIFVFGGRGNWFASWLFVNTTADRAEQIIFGMGCRTIQCHLRPNRTGIVWWNNAIQYNFVLKTVCLISLSDTQYKSWQVSCIR